MTTMKLSRRLSYHLTAGAPKNHMKEAHKSNLTRANLEENTEILAINRNLRRLPIMEALFIKELGPSLNTQAEDLRVLPSMRRTYLNVTINNNDDVIQGR